MSIKPVRIRAKIREKSAAKDLGGRCTISSGSLWFDKGDFKTDVFLFEDKYTDNNDYTIHLSELIKIEKQAMQVMRVPVFRFGYEKHNLNLAVIHEGYFTELNTADILEIEIDKKSKRFSVDYFKMIGVVSPKLLCILNFTSVNKRFVVMTWDYFKDNIQNFTA